MPVKSSAFTSSNSTIAALLDGYSWTGTTGQSTSIGYNFGFTTESGTLFNSAQQAAALAAMQTWANVANINFSSASSSAAKLSFSSTAFGPSTAGLTTVTFSGERILAAEVQIDSTYTAPTAGNYSYLVMLHEVGHALGLKHPGSYGGGDVAPYLPSTTDFYQNTVMSYNDSTLVDSSNPPSTPMIYDIAAIQYLYGANTSYNSGTSTYEMTGAESVQTIWDGGGTDTISAINLSSAATIDLNEGTDRISYVNETIWWNAIGANIENAIGGSAGDTIYGSALANTLYGRGGTDSIYAGAGNDTLYGGTGEADPNDLADYLRGGAGSDLILGNGGGDTIVGGVDIADPTDSADTIYGGGGGDYITGNGGNDAIFGGGAQADPNDSADTIFGGGGSDYLLGNGGADSIYGGGAQADPNDSADTIYGGAGNDYILGNGGNDFIAGQEANDLMYGGAGSDIFYFGFGSGVDTIAGGFDNVGATAGDIIQIVSGVNGITNATAALGLVTYSGGNAILDLGSGNSVTILSVAVNSLTADDFAIV